MRHSIKDIVYRTTARLSHVKNGIATYLIDVQGTIYQWDIDVTDPRYEEHCFMVEFPPVEVMAWLRTDLLTTRFKKLN